MIKPAVVVVAYNRAKSLFRLLESLGNAIYPDNTIKLIISIDKGDNNQDVYQVANDFVWHHGEKEVVYQETNLKLKKHIIKCGDYSNIYGGVIILEDDLYVSPYFYQYAIQALAFSEKRQEIGGVSLYNHIVNVNNSEPHYIMNDKYDNWYLQFASSWGEAWTKDQWNGFMDWYSKNSDRDLEGEDIMKFVTDWPPSSWLKYFIKYIIEKNKFFLYPKTSLTTNFSDSGTHVIEDNTDFQVPLQYENIEYKFSTIKESQCVYDAFFENVNLSLFLNKSDITIDLYGTKTNVGTRYLLSRRILNYKIIESYSCSMRPHEANIILNIHGNDFFLYDLSVIEKNKNSYNGVRKMRYCLRYIRKERYGDTVFMIMREALGGMRKRIKSRLERKY